MNLGVTQAEASADYTDANHTLGLFARGRLTRRLSAQLEVTRLATDDDSTTIRVYSVTATLDLTSHPHIVPMLLAGTGLDRQSTSYGTYTHAHHFEGGLALEYRADGGFTAGVDVRIGGRSIDEQTAYALDKAPPNATLFAPASDLQAGQYRSARLYAGIRF